MSRPHQDPGLEQAHSDYAEFLLELLGTLRIAAYLCALGVAVGLAWPWMR